MTEKKVRAHMHRIWFHLDRLQAALNDAHNADVIVYPDGEYRDCAPCASMDELRKRIRLTTNEQVARAVESEIRKGNP